VKREKEAQRGLLLANSETGGWEVYTRVYRAVGKHIPGYIGLSGALLASRTPWFKGSREPF